MTVTGYPYDTYDGSDEEFEKLVAEYPLPATTTPQPGCEDTTRVYREGVFVGRICKQVVYDCTGRVREGDEFEAFVRATEASR
jgi:hypothetical protein